MTIDEFRRMSANRLEAIYGQEESQAVSLYLLESLLGLKASLLSLRKAEEIPAMQLTQLQAALARLQNHEPVQYVTATAYFWERPLFVNQHVLIPRQETEELVDWVLKENKAAGLGLLDIGTGSGCIALTLALEMQAAKVFATDVDADALSVAQRNAERHKAKLAFLQQDILQALPEDFSEMDIIVSNPPYIKESEKEEMMQHVLDHEPEKALFVPHESPLLFYQKIAELSQHWLKDGGRLYFEIHESYGREISNMLQQLGWADIQIRKDLNGKDRMARAINLLSSYS